MARVLLRHSPSERVSIAEKLLAAAEDAQEHRRVYGRMHPCYGGGSLMAVAGRFSPGAEPDFSDLNYCDCWIAALRAIRNRLVI